MAFFSSTKGRMLIIALLAIVVNTALYYHYGVRIVNDTHRYVQYSQDLFTPAGYLQRDFWYAGYSLLIALAHVFTASPAGVVVLQVLFYGIALAAVYDAAYSLFGDHQASFISCVTYILFIEIPAWNFYLLAESFYASGLCISIALMLRYDGTLKKLLLCLLVVLFTFFIKPTGIVLVVAFVLYVLLYHRAWLTKHRKVMIPVSLVLLTVVVVLANRMLGSFILIENYALGEVIYDITTLPYHPHKHLLMITPPDDLFIPAREHAPVVRVLSFVLHNPLYFLKLAGAKVLYFVIHIKPYYSWPHNVFIALTLFPLYYAALRSLLLKVTDRHIKIVFSVYILLHLLIIALTVEDWDGRFLMPLMPVLCMLAGGISIRKHKIIPYSG